MQKCSVPEKRRRATSELAYVEEKVKTNGSSSGGSVSLMQGSAVVYWRRKVGVVGMGGIGGGSRGKPLAGLLNGMFLIINVEEKEGS